MLRSFSSIEINHSRNTLILNCTRKLYDKSDM